MKKNLIQRLGFTLVEIVVVISIIGLSLPVFFNLIFNLGTQQVNLAALQKVKEEGDFIQQLITNTVRDRAIEIDSLCSDITISGSIKMCFRDETGEEFGYSVTGSTGDLTLASRSATVVSNLIEPPEDSERIPIVIESASFAQLNNKTVRFTYTLKHEPTADYLASPELTYSFYVVLRRGVL